MLTMTQDEFLAEAKRRFGEKVRNLGKFLQAEIAVTPNLQQITERGWNPQQVQPVQSRIIIPGRG